MTDRQIDLGDRTWKQPTEEASIRWSTSAKGNLFTEFRGFVIVIVEHRWKPGMWQYMTQPKVSTRMRCPVCKSEHMHLPNCTHDDRLPLESVPPQQQWQFYGPFESQDAAKASAINALKPKREPVPPVPVDESPSGRKIVL